jgi:hypothetical protein
MRFSLQYEHHKLPEWTSHYIRFSFLLAIIKPFFTQAPLTRSDNSSAQVRPAPLLSSKSQVGQVSTNTLADGELVTEDDPLEAWVGLLQQDCQKISQFYEDKSRTFAAELEDIIDYVWHNRQEMKSLLLTKNHQDPKFRIYSLQRAVESCHRHIWSLEVFLEVNGLAFKRLLYKLRKVSPSFHEDYLDSFQLKLQSYQRTLAAYRKKIYAFASEYITHKDIKQTKQLIHRAEVIYDLHDVRFISFCVGWALLSVCVGVVCMPALEDLDVLVPSFCVYRLIASFLLVLWMGCAVLYVFDYYFINWPSVFEIHHKTALFIKLMKVASGWTALLATFFMVHVMLTVKGKQIQANGVTFAGFMVFIALLLVSCYCLHPKVRKELALVLFHIIISPFGEVNFPHFFTGDVLTALSKPLADIYRSFCFLSSDSLNTNTQNTCPNQLYWIYSFSVIPFVWRVFQCWNRFYYTRQWFPHLVNSGKYTFGILILTVTFFEEELNPSKPVIIVILVVGTLYMLAWDTLMDFGFRRFFTAVGRKQHKYPRWVYSYVGTSNVLLRLTWVISLVPTWWLGNDYLQVEVILLALCLLEILRIGQWALLRIENEKFSNIEKYRHEDFVPKMPKIILDD